MTKRVMITSYRHANHLEDVGHTMTVEDLIGFLEWCDPQAPVYIEGYDGFQFCGVHPDENIQEVDDETDNDY